MFERASILAHVCLRCQRQLARRGGQQIPQTNHHPIRVYARYQSTAVAPVVEEEENSYAQEPEKPNEDRNEQDQNNSQKQAEKLLSRDTYRTTQKSDYYTLRWTPHPSALLGVNTLGKPAEILILEPRDRKILQVPEGSSQERKESFYESLASEREPLNWDQLKDNIEQAKQYLGEKGSILRADQYTKLVDSLRKGFALSQLEKYIHKSQAQIPDAPVFPTDKRNVSKRNMIQYIARDLWGYVLPILSTRATNQSKHDVEKEKVQIIRFTNQKEVFEILHKQTQYRKLIRGIAMTHGADIQFVPVKHQIIIAGEKAQMEGARKEMIELKVSFKAIVLPLREPTANALTALPTEMIDSLLQELSMKHALPIKRNKSGKIEVICSNHRIGILRNIARDLQLALGKSVPTTDYSIWSMTEVNNLKGFELVPVEAVCALPWIDSNHSWNRLYATTISAKTSTLAQMEGRQRVLYEVLSRKVSNALGGDSVSWPLQSLNDLRYEHFARFGTFLAADLKPLATTKMSSDITKLPYTTFADDIPSLPQFINKLKRLNTTAESLQINNSNKAMEIVRAIYRTAEPKSDIPWFEVYLLAEDSKFGSKNPLQVARVSAIYDEKHHPLLLPEKSIDVIFTKQLKQDLFVLGKPDAIVHPHVLQALSEHLSKLQTATGDTLEPYVKLPIPSSVSPRQTIRNTEKSEENVEKQETSKTSKLKRHEFMLASLETVVSEAYRPPLKARFPLLYNSYNGGNWGLSRDELRLAEVPLLHALHEEKFRFHSFFHAAMDVAENLDHTAAAVLGGR